MKLKAIGILFTAVSLIACFDTSTDSEPTVVSCDVKSGLYNLNDNHACYESTDAGFVKSFCDDAQKELDNQELRRALFLNENTINIEELTIDSINALPPEFRIFFYIGEAKIGSGCPSGYANKCKRDNGEAYYYDDQYANVSCDEI